MKRYRLGLAAAAIAMIAPISGCAALISPQQTHVYQYAAGDGGSLKNLNGIDVRNVLLISNGSGDAQLIYALINSTDSTAKVEISVGTKSVTETVKPHQAVYHNPANTQGSTASDDGVSDRVTTDPVVVKKLDAEPGKMAPVTFVVNGQSGEVKAQVLTGDLPYYKDLAPTQPAPKSKATSTDSPSAGATADSTSEN